MRKGEMRIYNKQDDKTYDIPNINTISSPLLTTMKNTEVHIDVNDEGSIIMDCNPYGLEQYVKYLMGEDFEVYEDLFEYFGHENSMNYPLDFWKIKLRDTWIRDNCYRIGLFEKDPYYGLYQLECINADDVGCDLYNIFGEHSLPKGHYIAGGAALWVAGITNIYHGIDIFTTNIEETKRLIGNVLNDDSKKVYYTSNSIIVDNIQIMLRSYSYPSEIVHGFDVGCSGILYDGERLWCTQRALYSIVNRCNWIEPDRLSPSYIHRLLKYSNRNAFNEDSWKCNIPLNVEYYDLSDKIGNVMGGFKIMLTGIGDLKLDPDYHDELMLDARKQLYTCYYGCIPDDISNDEPLNVIDLVLELYNYLEDVDYDIQYKMMKGLYKEEFITSEPMPYIPRDMSIYQLLDQLKHELARRGTHFNWSDSTSHDKDYMDILMYITSKSIPTSREDLHPALNISLRPSQFPDSLYKMHYLINRYNVNLNDNRTLSKLIKHDCITLNVPEDPASLVLLECMYGIGYLASSYLSDYSSKSELEVLVNINDLQWKQSNLMEQLTESIDNMQEWYSTSPLIAEDGLDIVSKRYHEI